MLNFFSKRKYILIWSRETSHLNNGCSGQAKKHLAKAQKLQCKPLKNILNNPTSIWTCLKAQPKTLNTNLTITQAFSKAQQTTSVYTILGRSSFAIEEWQQVQTILSTARNLPKQELTPSVQTKIPNIKKPTKRCRAGTKTLKKNKHRKLIKTTKKRIKTKAQTHCCSPQGD